MPLAQRLTSAFAVLVLVGVAGCASVETAPPATPPDSGDGDSGAVESAEPTASASTEASASGSVSVPAQLQFTTQTVADEADFDAATLFGHDTILWFWAPWCPSCQAESGDLAEAAEELPDGVALMGVAGQSELPDMQSFVTEFGVGNFAHMADVDGSIWENFGIPYQPAYAFINDDGTIETVIGPMGKDGVLDAAARLAES